MRLSRKNAPVAPEVPSAGFVALRIRTLALPFITA